MEFSFSIYVIDEKMRKLLLIFLFMLKVCYNDVDIMKWELSHV